MIRTSESPARNRDFDFRIVGSGISVLLVASAILQARPDLCLLLETDDDAPGGDSLELILTDTMKPALIALFEPSQVASWTSFSVHGRSETRSFDGAVWLIDPVQAWLELATLANPPCFRSRAEADSLGGMPGANAKCGAESLQTIHLPADQFRVTTSRIIGAEFDRVLKEPVLADFGLSDNRSCFLQYVPLDKERVAIRTVQTPMPIESECDIVEHMNRRWDLLAEICYALT